MTEAAVTHTHPLLFRDALIWAAARHLELALLTRDGDILVSERASYVNGAALVVDGSKSVVI